MNNKYLVALAAAGMLSLSAPSFAQAGVYVGGQLGYGHTDYGLDVTFVNTATNEFININSGDENGIAGRIYLGYQFNCYFGVEVGAALFSNTDLNVNGRIDGQTGSVNLGDIETSQYDLLLKVGTPFGCSGFRGDIKLGIADVVTSFESNFNINGEHIDDSDSNVNFALGASISYNLNRQVALDVSWLHTFGNTPDNNNFNENRDWSPNTDLVTFGVSYTFL